MDGFSMTVTTSELSDAANRVKSYGEELAQLAVRYYNDVQGMRSNGTWVGEAAEVYASKCEMFKKNIDALNEKIQNLSVEMNSTAQSIDSKEAENVQRVNGLLG